MSEIRSFWRTARKTHWCDYCGHEIDREERYMVSTTATRQQIYDWKGHRFCDDFVSQEYPYKKWSPEAQQDGLSSSESREALEEWVYDLLEGLDYEKA